MSETRQRGRIRRAVESRGYHVAALEWEPLYGGDEGSGVSGGWTVVLDRPYLPNSHPGNELFGLNVDELLADIDYALPPSEPCDCDRTHNPNMAARLINDPQRPTHGPACRHHLNYRLSWWAVPVGDRGQQT